MTNRNIAILVCIAALTSLAAIAYSVSDIKKVVIKEGVREVVTQSRDEYRSEIDDSKTIIRQDASKGYGAVKDEVKKRWQKFKERGESKNHE